LAPMRPTPTTPMRVVAGFEKFRRGVGEVMCVMTLV